MSDEHMKSTSRRRGKTTTSDMRGEYNFDYSRAKPNRYAAKLPGAAVAVVLDPDVASVFGSSTQVNALLRSLISALPAQRPTTRTRTHRRKAS